MSCKNLLVTLVKKDGKGDAKDLNYKNTVKRLMNCLSLEYIIISPQVNYDDKFIFFIFLKLRVADINLDRKTTQEKLKECFCGAENYSMKADYYPNIEAFIGDIINNDRNPYCYGFTVKDSIKIAEPFLKYDDLDFLYEIFMYKKSWKEACKEEEAKFWLKKDKNSARNLYELSKRKD